MKINGPTYLPESQGTANPIHSGVCILLSKSHRQASELILYSDQAFTDQGVAPVRTRSGGRPFKALRKHNQPIDKLFFSMESVPENLPHSTRFAGAQRTRVSLWQGP